MKSLKGKSWEWYEDALSALAPSTQQMYLPAFLGFLEWGGWDTETLYGEHLANSRAEDPREIKRIPKKLFKYQKYLMEEKGKGSGTASTVEKAVKKFFKANELPFEMSGERIKIEMEEIPNISKEQLRRALNSTGNYKFKAFIMFAKDSGLRLGDMTHIPVSAVRAAIENPDIEYHTFEWKTRKTGRMANPVIGPETLESLREWMRYRAENLGLSAEDGEPLFCIEKTSNGYVTKRGKKVRGITAGGWMDEGNMGVRFSNLVKKAGLKETGISIHSCRKYHKTSLEYAGVPISWINRMQGRKGVGTGGVYSKPDPDQIIEVYRRAYDKLMVYGVELSEFERDKRGLMRSIQASPISEETKAWRIGLIRGAETPSELDSALKLVSEEQKKIDARKHTMKLPRPKIIESSKEDIEAYQKLGYVVVGDAYNGNVYMRLRE